MPQRVPSLQLPLAKTEPARETSRQLAIWAGKITSVINSLSADPGLQSSGNPGSGVTTITFSGAGASIDISSLMHFVEGGVSLATIRAPRGFTGSFFMIAITPFALVAGGNIEAPGGSVALSAGEMVPMVFDGKNWYPSVPVASNPFNIKIITYADSPYSVQPADNLIIASAGTDADTVVLLPATTGSARRLEIKKVDANPYGIAITPAGADTIDDGAGAFEILSRYAAFSVIDYVPGKWAII
jgi:hypothetical protein